MDEKQEDKTLMKSISVVSSTKNGKEYFEQFEKDRIKIEEGMKKNLTGDQKLYPYCYINHRSGYNPDIVVVRSEDSVFRESVPIIELGRGFQTALDTIDTVRTQKLNNEKRYPNDVMNDAYKNVEGFKTHVNNINEVVTNLSNAAPKNVSTEKPQEKTVPVTTESKEAQITNVLILKSDHDFRESKIRTSLEKEYNLLKIPYCIITYDLKDVKNMYFVDDKGAKKYEMKPELKEKTKEFTDKAFPEKDPTQGVYNPSRYLKDHKDNQTVPEINKMVNESYATHVSLQEQEKLKSATTLDNEKSSTLIPKMTQLNKDIKSNVNIINELGTDLSKSSQQNVSTEKPQEKTVSVTTESKGTQITDVLIFDKELDLNKPENMSLLRNKYPKLEYPYCVIVNDDTCKSGKRMFFCEKTGMTDYPVKLNHVEKIKEFIKSEFKNDHVTTYDKTPFIRDYKDNKVVPEINNMVNEIYVDHISLQNQQKLLLETNAFKEHSPNHHTTSILDALLEKLNSDKLTNADKIDEFFKVLIKKDPNETTTNAQKIQNNHDKHSANFLSKVCEIGIKLAITTANAVMETIKYTTLNYKQAMNQIKEEHKPKVENDKQEQSSFIQK